MNASTELIPGMDMLIDHMKKQSLEIERLKEENNNLNKYLAETKIHLCFEEDMNKLKEELETSNIALNIVKDENEVNKNNNAKLRKENKIMFDRVLELEDELETEELSNELQYMVFELVSYLKDNEGNIYSVDEPGPILATYDDIADKMIWKSKAAKNAHQRMAGTLLKDINK